MPASDAPAGFGSAHAAIVPSYLPSSPKAPTHRADSAAHTYTYNVFMREGVRCPCRRYTGPLPVEDYFARPLLPPRE
ncbi:hypothetical protein F5X71_25785 [Nocardia brasiliensis]|uniref:Uncharacterized protein n=1 Tax=Nocardia brasiliensis TaxID=37326 RepID=A0A6G9XWN4_NOCBR|nr:hypothetical protein F5X71_25785 [Nocardia brasiliensis]